MKKLLLMTAFITSVLNAEAKFKDNNASKITREDLKIMLNFENSSMKIAENVNLNNLNINEVSNFIWRNRRRIISYKRWKVDALGTAGYRTAKGGQNNSALINNNNYNYYKIGLQATYNLYDGKTLKDINNQKVDAHSKIIASVSDYANCKNELKELKIKLELERLEQIRMKLQVKTAQKYLDARIKVIENIMQFNISIQKKETMCDGKRLNILNLVTVQARNNLKDML